MVIPTFKKLGINDNKNYFKEIKSNLIIALIGILICGAFLVVLFGISSFLEIMIISAIYSIILPLLTSGILYSIKRLK